MATGKKDKPRTDFMALVAPKTIIKKHGVLKADLFRMRKLLGADLKAGTTDQGDIILYAESLSTWRKMVQVFLPFTDFREQRVDKNRTKISLIEIVDKDEPLLA